MFVAGVMFYRVWVYHVDWDLLKACVPMPLLVSMIVSRTIRKYTHAQGIGRHTEQELVTIGQDDLKALSVFLGEP